MKKINQDYKILIIDDNSGDIFLIKEILESSATHLNNKLTSAGDLTSAFEIISKEKFDLILLDLSLPDCHGLETLLKVLNFTANEIPIIVLTGNDNDKTGIDSIKLGAQDYLVKGDFDLKILTKSIKYSTERHRLLLELKTSRKKELEISEARYYAIVEDQTELICRISKNGSVNFANEAYCRFFSINKSDIKNCNFFSFIIERDIDFVKSKLNNLKTDSKILTFEHRVLIDNHIKWLHWTCRTIIDKKGDHSDMQLIGNDITEQKKAEKALRESEEKYRTMMESISDMVYILGKDRIIKYMNQSMINFYNADFTGQICHKSLYKSDTVCAKCPLEDVMNGRSVQYETQSDDDSRTYRISSSPIFNDDGTIDKISFITDITEIKKIEEKIKKNLEIMVEKRTQQIKTTNESLVKEIERREKIQEILREREEKYRALAENISDMICETDLSGRYIYLSPNNKDGLGYDISELQGRYFFDFIHPEDIEQCRKEFNRIIKLSDTTKTSKVLSFRYKRKNGTYIWCESVGKIYKTADGQHRAVIVTRDITNRKTAEEELLKNSKLESLSVLAGGIAHDFNNFLTGIIGNISMAKINAETDISLLEPLNKAEYITMQAKNLTSQLLAFSKGGLQIKKNIVISDIIKNSVNFTIHGSNVICEFKIAENLNNIEADEGQLNQVITNIIINAVQAMPDGGKILISAENVFIDESGSLTGCEPGNYVQISIKDNGIGISAENMNKIFDPYFTTKSKGNGLGLASAYSIIKNHSGYLFVNSALDQGTTIKIMLPAASSGISANEKSTIEENKIQPEIINEKNKKRVLIMDDEVEIRNVTGQLLTHMGFDVMLAADGNEAITHYKKVHSTDEAFDVIVVDLTVPGGMGGMETITKIKEFDPKVKAIAASGYFNGGDTTAATEKLNSMFKTYINKPYKIQELIKVINSVIDMA
ncbi:MAG: PAS domain S-box protein [Candidatus Wallbacteria bacterium]